MTDFKRQTIIYILRHYNNHPSIRPLFLFVGFRYPPIWKFGLKKKIWQSSDKIMIHMVLMGFFPITDLKKNLICLIQHIKNVALIHTTIRIFFTLKLDFTVIEFAVYFTLQIHHSKGNRELSQIILIKQHLLALYMYSYWHPET